MPFVFSFEIEHVFAEALHNDRELGSFLQQHGFHQQHRANQVAMYSNPKTVAALQDAPQAVKDLYKESGWGANRHDQTNRPDNFQTGKNAFLRGQIENIRDSGAKPDAQRYALLELFDWTRKLALGEISDGAGNVVPVQGAANIYSSLFDATKIGIEKFASGESDAIARQPYLDSVKSDIDAQGTVNKSGDSNEPMCKEAVKALADASLAEGLISEGQHRDVLKILAMSGGGNSSATPASIVLGADLNSNLKLVPHLEPLYQKFAVLIRVFTQNESGAVQLPSDQDILALAEKLRGVFDAIAKHAGAFVDSFSGFDKTVIDSMAASIKSMVVGAGGNFVGDAVEFLNAAYGPIKKGFQTGDWSDFNDVVVQYGIAAAVSALLVVGSVVAVTAVVGVVAGAPAAAIAGAFVAAGWAALGLYEAVTNGAELIGKIAADLAAVIPKIGDMINDLQGDLSEALRIIKTVFETATPEGFEVPDFTVAADGKSLVNTYLVDGADKALPDRITGGSAAEHFYGRNNAFIDAGEGDDEIYIRGVSNALGNAGDDILAGGRATVIQKGQSITGQPGGPIAVSDLRLTLDGGAGNDWVIALGGEKAVTIGGTGRDWIFNSSKGGIVYGDTVDGRSPDGSDLEAKQNADNFWWWSDVTLMDARQNDVLTFFGIPLTGGSQTIPAWVMGSAGFNPLVIGANNLSASAVNAPMYFDNFLPFMIYTMKGNDLHVVNLFSAMAGGIFTAMYPGSPAVSSGAMVVKDFEFKSSPWGFQLAEWTLNQNTGDLNMVFKDANPWLGALALYGVFGGAAGWLLGMMLPMLDELANTLAATLRLLKGVGWSAERDPLVLDLDGDGLESVALGDQAVYFDTNGDVFGERTAWLSGDDGFLTLDRNGNGRIDDLSEMFGPQTGRGFQDLRLLDSNSDGAITAADRDFARISVWQDRDQDGATDAGELMSLSHHRITRIDIAGARELDITTPQGVELLAESSFTRADGSRGAILEAIFATNPVDTQFKGEKGIAAWLANAGLNAKGYGRLTDLSVAMSNDFGISQTVRQTAAAMTVPKLDTLVGQVGAVLEQWAQTLELTRELTPVLTRIVNGQTEVVDRGVYVETATGGHWTLASGAVVRGPGGAVIARPMLEQVMAQAAASGTQWKLEQLFSPVSRSAPLQHRDEAPYLAEIVDGRAVVKDYGIKAADGSWRLASGTTVTGGDGRAIARPTKNDILAMAPRPGHEWRLEEIGHNPYAAMSVERIGVNMVDGIAIDYSVEVTDRDGTFHVWARNLDRALELQHRDGTASAFGLRNHAIDFDELDEVGSSLDSTYRVEMLTPGQFHFMVSLVGVDFRPQMLAARIDGTTGVITYSVNESGRPSLEAEDYVSGIRPMIELLGQAVTSYIGVSRDFAVNLAMQGGLKSFFPGITYDMAGGFYSSTSGRELAPVFEAIFRAAPKGFDQAHAWLEDWNEILFRIYGDYRLNPAVNLQGATVRVDKAFIFQMMLPAFQNISIDVDLAAAMNAFTVDESRLRTHTAAARDVQGTAGVDFLLMTSGNQTLRGGDGADFYFAGRAFGNDVIHDRDSGGDDELRFTEVRSSDIEARREGQDLVLLVRNSTNQIRLKDQFLGELNEPKNRSWVRVESLKHL